MARALRVLFPGAIYHVCSRMLGNWGSERNLLFRHDEDRIRFLERLELAAVDFEVRLYLYCLMSNHFHLLVETPHGNLSRFMQSINTAYTVYFNRRYQRHGHLMDGRYKAELVAGDEYLLKLSRYIHLNPVAMTYWRNRPIKERKSRLRGYRWSSYRSYIGEEKGNEYLDMVPIGALAKVYGYAGPRGYRNYVEGGMAQTDLDLQEILKKSSRGIGDQNFRIQIERLRNRAITKNPKKEDVSFRRESAHLQAATVLSMVAEFYCVSQDELRRRQRGGILRPVTARMLVRFSGKTQREAADLLGLSTGAAVSVQLRRLNEMERKDRKIRMELGRLEKILHSSAEAVKCGG
ncbi:MAG: hypothetical protein HOI66_13320 [Verrucomicrobia bacterium]|jgi:putative transposase|nr:hypothetical protein [Verrucomicrobiota bacterium]